MIHARFIISWNLSPWGDGNYILLYNIDKSKGWNLSPWGDGNTSKICNYIFHMVEIYPREGTETPSCGYTEHHVSCWNLSPWGDGNGVDFLRPISTVELKFIPVRGRKQMRIIITPILSSWNLSPWGDGNERGKHIGQESVLKFIPVRGRKQPPAACLHVPPALKFIPVRGRKRAKIIII